MRAGEGCFPPHMMLGCHMHREGIQEWKIPSRLEPHKERLKSVSVLYATILGAESIQHKWNSLSQNCKHTVGVGITEAEGESGEDGELAGSAASSQQ